jgi:hypothetical protein
MTCQALLVTLLTGCASTRTPSRPPTVSGQQNSCAAPEVYVRMLCPEPEQPPVPESEFAYPRLLGRDQKPESCQFPNNTSDSVAQLEVRVDAQGRITGARVARSSAACDMACIEAAYSRIFLPSMQSGRTTTGEVRLLCRRRERP